MKIGAIIQARMGSTRLPGKVLAKIGEKTLLEHQVEFLKKSKLIDKIIIATSTNKENLAIKKLAKKINIDYFRGDEEDVLNRFVQAAKKFNIDIVVRICGDSFILDPENLDFLIKQHIEKKTDFSRNYLHENGLPPGAGAEVFSSKILEEINSFVKEQMYREHIDEYILQHPEKFKILKAKSTIKDQRFQFNIDKKKDLELAKKIYKNFNFDYDKLILKNVINFVENNKEFYKNFEQIKVIFRADGSNELGLGHISREIALAQTIKNKFKCDILFLINDDGNAESFILKHGFAVKKINYKDEKTLLKNEIEEFNPNLFVVDLPTKLQNEYSNYENLKDYINYLESFNLRVLQFIDSEKPDLTDADIIINSHPIDLDKSNYYSGYSYLLFKQDFLKENIKEPHQKVNSVLVTFGGGDVDNFTLKILKNLVTFSNLKITVVLGPFFKFSNEIIEFAKNNPQICVKQTVSNMAKLINNSDIAINAGGNTLLELAYFGVPSICICDEEHQLENIKQFNKSKIAISLGLKNNVNDKMINEAIKNLINNHGLRKEMSSNGRNLVNNQENERILEIIENQVLKNEN